MEKSGVEATKKIERRRKSMKNAKVRCKACGERTQTHIKNIWIMKIHSSTENYEGSGKKKKNSNKNLDLPS